MSYSTAGDLEISDMNQFLQKTPSHQIIYLKFSAAFDDEIIVRSGAPAKNKESNAFLHAGIALVKLVPISR